MMAVILANLYTRSESGSFSTTVTQGFTELSDPTMTCGHYAGAGMMHGDESGHE